MTSPTVTVAVATCGRPDGLARCLRALAAGTRIPDEVVIVDQAVSDGSRAAARSTGLAVRHEVQDRLGLSASRNRALDVMTSDVLAVTDDDCVPDRRWVECIATAVAAGAPVVTGAVQPLGEPGPGEYAISLRSDDEPRTFSGRAIPWAVGSGANTAGLRSALVDIGGWDERLGTGTPGMAGEDLALLDSLLRAGVPIRYEPGAIVRHEAVRRDRRLETRWSYGFGIGAFIAFRACERDGFAARMTLAYLRLHARPLVAGLVRLDSDAIVQHGRAVGGAMAGTIYGIRHRTAPTRRSRGGP